MNIVEELKKHIRDIPNFPKEGIIFKDITPILQEYSLCEQLVDYIVAHFQEEKIEIDAVAGIESRGFLFGMMIAQRFKVPFIPIRKKGKLPHLTFEQSYALEYGNATIEMHQDALKSGQRVLIHDDLLATGGTVDAASKLIHQANAQVAGFSFIIGLDFLGGQQIISEHSEHIHCVISY